MFRYRTGFVALLALLGIGASAQIAPVYKKFGFARPAERVQTPQTAHVKKRRAKISWPRMSGTALTSTVPQRYDIPITILTEEDKPLYLYPRISYELFQGSAKSTNKTLLTGNISLDSKGNTVLSITVKDTRYQTGIAVTLPDQKDEDPEYEFTESDKAYLVLPKAQKRPVKGQASKPITTKALSLHIKRNFATLTVKGIPPMCRVFVGESEVSVNRQSEKSDVVQLVLPMDVASNEDLQLSLNVSDSMLERKATVDAGKLLKSSGSPLSAYRLNSFTVPDSDWTITKLGFESLLLESLAPAFGNIKEIGLYTEEQAKEILGEPATTEAVYAFSKPDGSQWLHYPSKGISLKTREVNLAESKSTRIVEQVRLTSPVGGKIGGMSAGDTGERLYNRLGNGQTSEVFGKPRAGYRSYLSQGLQFSLDPSTSIVSSIEIWRPFTLLKEAALPIRSAPANKILINLPIDQLCATKGSNGANLAKLIPNINDTISKNIKACKALRITENADDADLLITWHISESFAEADNGFFAVSVTIKSNGNSNTSSFAVSASNAKDISSLATKLSEIVQNKILEIIGQSMGFYVRLKAIDYTSGEIEVDQGSADGLAAGALFEISNLDMPAFPDSVDLGKAKTKMPDGADLKKGAKLVLTCTRAGESTSTGQLAYLVKIRNSLKETVVLLDKQDWPAQIKRLLDPGTGLLLAKPKLVSE